MTGLRGSVMDRETIKFLEDQVQYLIIELQSWEKDIITHQKAIEKAIDNQTKTIQKIDGLKAAIKKLRE